MAVLFFAVTTGLSAQNRKYVMWYSPSNAEEVYGVMFNFFPREARFPDYTVYGVELDLNPLGLFFPIMLVVSGLFEPTMYRPDGNHWDGIDSSDYKKTLYGLHITSLDIEPYIINGLDIALAGSFQSVVNGAGISLIINKQDAVNGLTIAPVGNHNIYCRGVQIGLINTCSDLKGFQIGFWNVNQKRKSPLINWNFKRTVKKEKKEQQ